ncbi:MAG: hypothetical protein AAGF11_16845 [Myxococcota bacterium]
MSHSCRAGEAQGTHVPCRRELVATAYAKPDTAPPIRKALRLVDDLRAALKRRNSAQGREEDGSPEEGGSPDQPEVSPTTPVPELG